MPVFFFTFISIFTAPNTHIYQNIAEGKVFPGSNFSVRCSDTECVVWQPAIGVFYANSKNDITRFLSMSSEQVNSELSITILLFKNYKLFFCPLPACAHVIYS